MLVSREDIRSMKFVTENPIEKSLTSDLAYDSSFKIERIGKDIKEGIKQILFDNIISQNNLYIKLDDLVQSIGEAPTEIIKDSELNGLKKRLTIKPLRYPYKKVYPNHESYNNENNLFAKYNCLVSEYLEISIDNIVLKTIYDGLSEEKIYQLNGILAAKFGL